MNSIKISLLLLLCLGFGGFAIASSAEANGEESKISPKEETRFVISAEIRERGVYSHGYEHPLILDQKGSFFVGQRTRLNFDFQKGPLGFFVQIEDGRID